MPPGSHAVGPGAPAPGCVATEGTQSGPNYTPEAPERTSVGSGYVLTGSVVEEGTCKPLPAVQVEVWMAGPEGAYGPDWQATFHTDEQGHFRFESHIPVGYEGTDAHVHLRFSSPDHRELFTAHFPEKGATTGEVAVVLARK